MGGMEKTVISNAGAGGVCAASAFFALLYLVCYAMGIIWGFPLPQLVLLVFAFHIIYLFSFKVFLFKYIWLIAMLVWLVVADALLEITPIWLNELQLATFENGSVLPIATCVSASLQLLLFLETLNGKSSPFEDCKEKEAYSTERITLVKVAGIVALILATCAFLCVVQYPSWAVARDRFDYAANYLPSFLRVFQSLLILLIPLAAPCLKIGARRIFYGVVGFYGLYLIWTGEKFTSLFLLFYVLVLILGVPKLRRIDSAKVRRLFRKIIAVIFVVFVCFFMLIFIQYFRQFGSVDAAIGTFEQRIAAQAEVWWGTYEQVQNSGDQRLEEIDDELSSINIVSSSDEERTKGGMWKLMRIVMPSGYYQMYVENSTRLTSSTQATLYYYFGYPGMLLGMLMLALFYYFVINAATSAFERGRILEGVLSVYLIRIMHGVILMSDFGDLFYWRSLVVVAVLAFLAVLRTLSTRKAYFSSTILSANKSVVSAPSHDPDECRLLRGRRGNCRVSERIS